jgi:6-phosphogluconolactonase
MSVAATKTGQDRRARSMNPDVELQVFEDAELAAEAAARLVADCARAGGNIALSGGSSPRPAYERAAVLQADWHRVELWWVDDRCVPPDDSRSNYRTIRESLIDGLSHPPHAIHRIRGELAPDEAARDYDAALEGVQLALALMGIGPDGHTASLFPNAPTLDEAERRAVATDAGLEPFVPRVTMTRPVLSTAATMVYLATGETKAEAVELAFAQTPSPATPASLVRGRRTLAILDRAAASRLEAK